MLPTEPKVGWFFRYSYLWYWQHLEGREEGDKDRPVLVLAIVAALDDEMQTVRVLPVTHSPPFDPADAVEITAATKRRLGLDDERSCIVLTESNRFVWPGPDARPLDNESGYWARCRRRCSTKSSAVLSSWRADSVIAPLPAANDCAAAIGPEGRPIPS